jgi:hypothetical protein
MNPIRMMPRHMGEGTYKDQMMRFEGRHKHQNSETVAPSNMSLVCMVPPHMREGTFKDRMIHSLSHCGTRYNNHHPGIAQNLSLSLSLSLFCWAITTGAIQCKAPSSSFVPLLGLGQDLFQQQAPSKQNIAMVDNHAPCDRGRKA